MNFCHLLTPSGRLRVSLCCTMDGMLWRLDEMGKLSVSYEGQMSTVISGYFTFLHA